MSHGAGWVSVRGVKCPIIGLMCMDQCTIDVTDVPDVQVGDTVTIFSEEGGMDYRQGASISNFNRNGLQAATPRRVPKLYFENGELVAARDYMFDLD
jgi:alanine racemase